MLVSNIQSKLKVNPWISTSDLKLQGTSVRHKVGKFSVLRRRDIGTLDSADFVS